MHEDPFANPIFAPGRLDRFADHALIAFDANHAGKGRSAQLVEAMRGNTSRLGFTDLYAPVRPSQKHLDAHAAMAESPLACVTMAFLPTLGSVSTTHANRVLASGNAATPAIASLMKRPAPEPVGPEQESVWSYPRPPALDPSTEHVLVSFGGETVADSHRPIRVLETSHAPVYYLPPEDVRTDLLAPTERRTHCEFKGAASYADLIVHDQRSEAACWWYASPTPAFEEIAGWIAFYPSRVERITVDGEIVRPAEGDFYGGWVTARVVGPFKGGPGTQGW